MRPFIKNELFEGIVSREEYLLLNNDCIIDKSNAVLISISTPNRDYLSREDIKGWLDVLEIQFYDVEEDIGPTIPLISNSQGYQIKEFINRHKDKRFMIHCDAGQSRSAGVGCAVECIVNYDGEPYSYQIGTSEIKKNKIYSPNFAVYRVIVNSVKESCSTTFWLCNKCGATNESDSYCCSQCSNLR